MCGGNEAQSYYDTDIRVAGPPKNIRVKNRTESSITLQWTHPDSQLDSTSITQYIIRAKVLKTFANYALLPPPQWTIQKHSDAQIELSSLHPATKYNITIISDSESNGEGGSSSIVAETEIGVPDPIPAEPHIISKMNQKLEIEIPQAINNNGPISALHVVVIFVDSKILQNFDEHLLTNYNQAQEDGSSYYITAELNYDVRFIRF